MSGAMVKSLNFIIWLLLYQWKSVILKGLSSRFKCRQRESWLSGQNVCHASVTTGARIPTKMPYECWYPTITLALG